MATLEAAFRDALTRAGIRVEEPILADGRIHRCHALGDKPKSKNAWYILHDGLKPIGRYGSWRLGINRGWVGREARPLSEAERVAAERSIEHAQSLRAADLKRREERARRRGKYIWEHAAALAYHPYLEAKGVQAHGLREYKGSIVVPLLDSQGGLWSLQFIGADGAKKFLTDGRVMGCFCALRGAGEARLWIAEGFATGATIQELTGETVLVAFNAGNLRPVAEAVRGRMPGVELAFAVDNDRWTAGNPGLKKGYEAAAAVGGRLAVPFFNPGCGKPTDWNDLRRLRGDAEARARLLRLM